jgi:hypothetical protein
MNDSPASMPEYLKIRVGGILGPVYSLRMKENKLLYRVRDDENSDEYTEKEVHPGDSEWQAFRLALDKIGIWRWHEEYPNPDGTEGTQWYLEIEWGERRVKSSGDNNFPVADGDPENEADISPTFEHLLEAVRRLLGGMEFR